MKLKCDFFYWGGDYTCYISLAAITEPRTEISEIQGDHEARRSNEDVSTVWFNVCAVHFIPRKITVFFPNVTELWINECGLKSICREDLKEFKNLERLELRFNELTTLPDDLFRNSLKLTTIRFHNNKIDSMTSKLFDPIINNKFELIDFQDNTKIDAFYCPRDSRSVASVAALMAIIDSQCSKPEPTEVSTDLSPIQCQNLTEGFENLFTSGEFSDFVITVNGSKQFHVHKYALAAQSEGFADLFRKDPGATDMKIEDLRPEAVEKFLRYLYTGKLENFAENSLEIFALASILKVPTLKQHLETAVISQLNESNALKAFSLAHSSGSDNLKRASFKEIQKMFQDQELPENLIENLEKVKEIVGMREKLRQMINKMKNV